MEVDGSAVYWADFFFGRVMKAPLGGGEAVAIACNQASPAGIALDATHVYWTNFGDGTIMKAPKLQ